MQTLPGHETTILTGQKHKTGGDLARLPGPTHRRRELIQSILLHRRRDQRRPDGAGTNAVDADAEAELLVREPAREGHDGAFAGGVVEEVRAADVGVYGGAVDDRVARGHVLEGVFADVEHGVHVCVEGADPLVSVSARTVSKPTCGCASESGRVEKGSGGGRGGGFLLLKFVDAVGHVLVPGVIDQDIDGAHSRHGFLDELLAILPLGDVGGVEVDFAAVLFHFFLRVLRIALFFG